MKKTLLTGIAVLFLATGTAHAIEYECGANTTVYVQKGTLHVTHEPTTEASVVIRVETSSSNGKRWPIVRYDIEKEKLTVNGQRCKGPK